MHLSSDKYSDSNNNNYRHLKYEYNCRWIEIEYINCEILMNTYGKNLNALTSKLFFVNASRMSSSDTVVLQIVRNKIGRVKVQQNLILLFYGQSDEFLIFYRKIYIWKFLLSSISICPFIKIGYMATEWKWVPFSLTECHNCIVCSQNHASFVQGCFACVHKIIWPFSLYQWAEWKYARILPRSFSVLCHGLFFVVVVLEYLNCKTKNN